MLRETQAELGKLTEEIEMLQRAKEDSEVFSERLKGENERLASECDHVKVLLAQE